MLCLAVHSFAEVTAKVPFAIILLQDFVSNKKCPPELKCRQLTPSSGSRSSSLWDVPDPEALLQWLNENVAVDCTHEVFEVQEEFSIGIMGEVGRARAAEKVAAGAKELGEKTAAGLTRASTAVSHQAAELDHKLKISERAAAAAEAVKESAVARGTMAFFGKAGSAVKTATHKVVDNDRVSSGTSKIGSSFKKLGSMLSNKGRMNTTSDDDASALEEQPPQYARAPAAYEAPEQEQSDLRNPSVAATAPAAAASPPAAEQPASPQRASVDNTPASPPPETVAFTLDDSEPTPVKRQ